MRDFEISIRALQEHMMPRRKKLTAVTCLAPLLQAAAPPLPRTSPAISAQVRQAAAAEASPPLDRILRYISAGWRVLTRSTEGCKTFRDEKTDEEAVLYFPADFPIPAALHDLPGRCHIRFAHLPRKINAIGANNFDPNKLNGLLYLEHPYVVPGGQFNEMYGWDSYFIILGLLRDNRIEEAKGMVENFYFEVEQYGGVLNANRTYYLTRSQPPFLSSMVLAVYEAESERGDADPGWLETAYGYIVRDYGQWNRAPHLAGDTGLSRYFDHGEGPVPEILGDPSNYYRGAASFLLLHEGAASPHLTLLVPPNSGLPGTGRAFPIYVCNPNANVLDSQQCAAPKRVALTADFYKGDRSMRESGFDVTFRFGPFGADTHHYAPVCLNSLLYKTEKDLEEIAGMLGKNAEAGSWKAKAEERSKLITKYLWNAERGLYFDYDFTIGKQSTYEYATTFYPLWAGLASEDQAQAIERNLPLFEQSGGIAMSRRDTQAQWDFPYGWAPIHLLAVEGLRRYGDTSDADRVAHKFLTTVLENFLLDGTVREKYDVTTESAKTHILEGYRQNVVGFGWTNGVFVNLLHGLPADLVSSLNQTRRPTVAPGSHHSNSRASDPSHGSPAPGKELKP
jgi:alpha,alpha-trehalase